MQANKIYNFIFLSLLLTTTVAAQDEKINGNIALQMGSNDSMYVVTATVTNIATQQPAKNVELTFYIQRTFGLMKVADGTTDSTGIITAEFPSDIRGHDSSKNFILIAKVEESDVMKDTAFQVSIQSKFPFPADKPIPRSIAGAHAPWWLVITFIAAVGAVWLLFVYVLYLVYRIKKASIKIIS
ncbi:MAG: hypothetical protein J0H85_04535 [Sediminibacterium magnilacihabitans]|jgi:hypothetical protein|nr:hypothetical protein [Sediminibacterium magnilacihabitans]PQV61831.1 hypothetical protein CLV53_101105 [Sediminibacterium magnilacihabitans]